MLEAHAEKLSIMARQLADPETREKSSNCRTRNGEEILWRGAISFQVTKFTHSDAFFRPDRNAEVGHVILRITLVLAAAQTNSEEDRKRAKITARLEWAEWAEARRFL
jgi:hypothetical protein